jgi:uncharacterized membrane protein YhfC
MKKRINQMLTISFVVSVLVEFLFPVVLAIFLVRRYRRGWALVGVGALTFIASQVVHLPLVLGWGRITQTMGSMPITSLRILNAVVLGLLAGLCEETARWIGYRLLKQRGNSWGSALTIGAGHGGIESILLAGLPVLSTFVVMHLVRSGMPVAGITPVMVADYFSMAWHLPLAGALERLMAIALHITLSVMVWLAVSRRSPAWFWGAVAWHALVDAAVVSAGAFGAQIWTIEGVMAVFTAVNLAFLWRTSQRPELTAEPAQETNPDAAVETVQEG